MYRKLFKGTAMRGSRAYNYMNGKINETIM